MATTRLSLYTKEDLDAMSSIYNLVFANKVTWPEVLELIEESIAYNTNGA